MTKTNQKYMKMNWISYYDKFAPFYDRFYNDYKDDIAFYQGLAASTNGNIIEIGCGTGRVLIPLSEVSQNVTGLDYSKKMIEICKEKLVQKDLKSRINIMRANMCDFRINKKFALILVPFHSFSHLMDLDDQISALNNFKNHLSSDGKLVIDLFNPDIQTMYEWNHKTLRLKNADFIDDSSKCLVKVSQSFDYDYINQNIIWTNYFEKIKSGKIIKIYEMKGGLHYFWKNEFDLLLKYLKFHSWNVYGGYDMKKLTETSEEMIWIIEKK